MRQLSGNNWLASADQLPPAISIGDGPQYGYASNRREVALWTLLFALSNFLTIAILSSSIYCFAQHADDMGAMAFAVAVLTGAIGLFMLTRPPWSITLNASNRSYQLNTGFRPFIKRRTGPLSDIRGIGAATVQRRGEEACVLFLVFVTSERPFFLAWHPLPSAQIVALEASQLGKRLNVPVISSKTVLKG